MSATQAIASIPAAVSSQACSRRERPTAAAARPRPAAALARVQRLSSSSRASAGRQRVVVVRAVTNVTDATWEEEVLKSPVPVLVDFWANWCGPCKLMHPMMDWAQKEYGESLKVVKVEADPNPGSIEKYKVYGLPCFIVFKDGQEVEGSHSEGAMTKKALTEYVAKHAGVAAPAKA